MEVSLSTLCKFLSKSGFTHKRLRTVALHQDKALREQFSSEVSVYDTDMFVFVDEAGSDQRNKLRRYGYSIRGIPVKTQKFLVRGERISAIACMSSAGLMDVKTLHGTANGEVFYSFVQTHLLPHLMPYNGTNPHSVVVLDNCSIHHVAEVVKSINDVGAHVLFLPPYSPDLNPIEELFSKVITTLKSAEDIVHTSDLETLLLYSFTSVTEEDCMGWINHSQIIIYINNKINNYYVIRNSLLYINIKISLSFVEIPKSFLSVLQTLSHQECHLQIVVVGSVVADSFSYAVLPLFPEILLE